MKVNVYKTDGSKTRRKVTLEPSIFEIAPNDHAIWLDVRSLQANARQGTHKVKGRSEVRGGGGAKPWRQKGTGRARVGTTRSPLWAGGGSIFGPSPRTYTVNVNRKTKRLARRSALAYRAQADGIRVLEDFSWEEPKTRRFAEMMAAFEAGDRNVLVLTGTYDPVLYKSGRNLKKVSVREAATASTIDILNADLILMQESAVKALNGLLGAVAEETTEDGTTEDEA